MYSTWAALLITAGVTILFVAVFAHYAIKSEVYLKRRKKITAAGWLLAFVLAGTGVLIMYQGNEKEEAAKALEYAKLPSLEEIARNAVHEAIPKSNLVKNGEAVLSYQYDEKHNVITLQVEANKSSTNAKVKNEIKGYTLTIIKSLYKDPRVEEVRITWYYPRADYKGEEKNMAFIQSDFSRKRMTKIFERTNLTLEKIEKPSSVEILADQFAENPTFAPVF